MIFVHFISRFDDVFFINFFVPFPAQKRAKSKRNGASAEKAIEPVEGTTCSGRGRRCTHNVARGTILKPSSPVAAPESAY